jgi:hypothetical protein
MKHTEPGWINTKAIAKHMEGIWLKSLKERGMMKYDSTPPPEIDLYGPEGFRRISICTTVMNRLDDLKLTLPKNMADNADYPNLEFVVLDYNSSDGLGDWIKAEMMEHIKKGRLVYARTSQPKYFHMSHSRNLAFKVASGEIVNNLDADNFCQAGFAAYVNRQAAMMPRKAIFAKSRQLLRGRLGFYKDEWEALGGYNQSLGSYGHDDADLLHRAWESGFTLMAWSRGGNFVGIVPNHQKHVDVNMEKAWWVTEGENRMISFTNLIVGKLVANEGRHWGEGHLTINFEREVDL